jgi:predicted phosphodiesterase
MALQFVGIGDLHLDGKIRKYLENLNERILFEVSRVLDYARRNGVELIVFYGDICETPNMSQEATKLFLRLLMENSQFKFLIILGNHDKENSEQHSLQLFVEMLRHGMLPHVRVFEKPTTLFRKSGTPLRLLPWPFLDTDPDAINVIHEAVSGSRWDHGRAVDGAKVVKDWCVAGHIHTAQTIGRVHFSGTLYQTSFGEKPKKYFHHVTWPDDGLPTVKKIRHVPGFQLENFVVETKADLAKLVADPNHLYKVFVKDTVVLDEDAFTPFPNVVKTNTFKTRLELEQLVIEELRLDDEFDLQGVLSVENTLVGWLDAAKVEDDMKRKVYRKYKSLFGAKKGAPS